MTLVSDIVTSAFRESNVIPLGKVPNANQSTEALSMYNALMASLYGDTVGEDLEDWPLGTFDRDPNGCEYLLPYTDHRLFHPAINRRLIVSNSTAMTVWLTTRPQDGARMGIADPFSRLSDVPITLQGNGRPIEGAASIVLATDGTFREWFYRADLAAWVKLTDLALTDAQPFPAQFDMMFGIMLGMRLNPRYGRTLDQQSALALKNTQRKFINRYLQSRPLEGDDSISWPFMSRQGYDTERAFSSTHAFNRGTRG